MSLVLVNKCLDWVSINEITSSSSLHSQIQFASGYVGIQIYNNISGYVEILLPYDLNHLIQSCLGA